MVSAVLPNPSATLNEVPWPSMDLNIDLLSLGLSLCPLQNKELFLYFEQSYSLLIGKGQFQESFCQIPQRNIWVPSQGSCCTDSLLQMHIFTSYTHLPDQEFEFSHRRYCALLYNNSILPSRIPFRTLT